MVAERDIDTALQRSDHLRIGKFHSRACSQIAARDVCPMIMLANLSKSIAASCKGSSSLDTRLSSSAPSSVESTVHASAVASFRFDPRRLVRVGLRSMTGAHWMGGITSRGEATGNADIPVCYSESTEFGGGVGEM